MDWIDLARDREQWMALVNTVMNLQVQYNAGKFLNMRGDFIFRIYVSHINFLGMILQNI
jgi:hypothetical protein